VTGNVRRFDGRAIAVAGKDAGDPFAGGKGVAEDAARRGERRPETGERWRLLH
jgi:hypothetical protein